MVTIDFEKQGGLVPVIAQDYETGDVLMLAFMNQETWDLTLKTGIVHYWSRSRKKIWKKGSRPAMCRKSRRSALIAITIHCSSR